MDAPSSNPTILVEYASPSSPSPSLSPPLTHLHTVAPLPSHFSFPPPSAYSSPSLLRVDWPEHGYHLDLPHLSDLTLLISTSTYPSSLLPVLTSAGYRLTPSTPPFLHLTCHRVVLSTASPLLRSLIHGPPPSPSPSPSRPSSYAAISLTFSHTPLIPLLHLLHTLYHPLSASSIPLPHLIPTMQLARQLEAYNVLSSCQAHTTTLLSPSTLLPLYTAACQAYEGLALNAITDYLTSHMRAVLQCAELEQFTPFLKEVIGGLVRDSEAVVREGGEGERAELVRLFQARMQPKVADVLAVEGVAAEGEDMTLTQLIRKQRAQPLFDALTSLCSLFFMDDRTGGGHAGKGGKAAESLDDLALSFGAPPSVTVGDDDSDSDWDSDEEDDVVTPPGKALLSPPLPTPSAHLFSKPTSPRHRLQEKISSAFAFPPSASKAGELPDCSLTIQTAAKPPKHPRTHRDRSCPLRRASEGPAVVPMPPRVRRPSAPSIY